MVVDSTGLLVLTLPFLVAVPCVRLTGPAVKSLVALTILMSLFTIATLWLLSLPIVTEGG